jgi:hypothetical protein
MLSARRLGLTGRADVVELHRTETEPADRTISVESKPGRWTANIHKLWQLGSLDVKKKIQKMVFPEGIVVDTTNRTYLTSNVNSLFLAKSQFMRGSEGIKEKLPIKNDEESSIVAEEGFEPSTFGL